MITKPVLAFDCAANGASVALLTRDGCAEETIAQSRQSAELVVVIDGLMRAGSLAYQQLGAIVTTTGPGSFTGLRVGLAALHGLALAAQVPVKTLSSLEAMAWAVALGNAPLPRFYVHLRAGKGELYVQLFEMRGAMPVAASAISLLAESHADWAYANYGNMVAADSPYFMSGPQASVLCRMAHALPETKLADAVPLYVRPPDAKIPATPMWLA